jgi:predicted nucleic acid-binding protein
VSEDAGAVPVPYVLDVSVLTAVARADAGVTNLVMGFDAEGRPLLIPALPVTAASLDTRTADGDVALRGLEALENTFTAALLDAAQATRLAEVISMTGLDPWDAHVAAVADASVCPILTLDGAKWREHENDLDERLHFIEIADPDEAPGVDSASDSE